MTYGTEAQLPNTAERQAMMMMPVFGGSDGLKPDASVGTPPLYPRKKLIDACTVDTDVAMLLERVPLRHCAPRSFRALDIAVGEGARHPAESVRWCGGRCRHGGREAVAWVRQRIPSVLTLISRSSNTNGLWR
jgi:hypothetical protein